MVGVPAKVLEDDGAAGAAGGLKMQRTVRRRVIMRGLGERRVAWAGLDAGDGWEWAASKGLRTTKQV